MKKKGQQFIILLILSSIIGGISVMCTGKASELPADEFGYPTSASYFMLSEDELVLKIPDALNGDPEVAYGLALHFLSGSHDRLKGYEWVEIATENGQLEAQKFYTMVFAYNEKKELNARVVFWLYGLAKIRYDEYAEVELNRYEYTIETAQPPDDDQFPDNYSQLSETELAGCETGALQGNRKAPFLLGKYYGEVAEDSELSEYWYRIGAQNGSPDSMHELGQIMSRKDDPLAQIRGKFWLDKAAQSGYYD
jgi:TPR repeat protein